MAIYFEIDLIIFTLQVKNENKTYFFKKEKQQMKRIAY